MTETTKHLINKACFFLDNNNILFNDLLNEVRKFNTTTDIVMLPQKDVYTVELVYYAVKYFEKITITDSILRDLLYKLKEVKA